MIEVYIQERFYAKEEVEFTFWMLLENGLVPEANLLYHNERSLLDSFLEKYAALMGVKSIKVSPKDVNLLKIPKTEKGIKWAFKQTIMFKTHKIMNSIFSTNEGFLLKRREFLRKCKRLA